MCKECYSAILPFSDLDHIDFINVFHENGQHPCKKCKRNCLIGSDLMKCIQCVSCKQPFHLDCTNVTKSDYEKFGSSTYDFVCSEKCYTRLFPSLTSLKKSLMISIRRRKILKIFIRVGNVGMNAWWTVYNVMDVMSGSIMNVRG